MDIGRGKSLNDTEAARSSEDLEAGQTQGWMSWLSEVSRHWLPAIAAVIVIRTFIFEPFRIPSGSMVPTLLIGDHVAVTKFSYGIWAPFFHREILDLGDPERGDVIVFRYPRDPSLNYIKRVVGVPGDRIRVQDNKVLLNGKFQQRHFKGQFTFFNDRCRPIYTNQWMEDLSGREHPVLTNLNGQGMLASPDREWIVPEDQVFVMGDNRDNSEDSRRWGFVRYDQIKGKAHLIWLSWNACEGNFGEVRSERFFQKLQ